MGISFLNSKRDFFFFFPLQQGKENQVQVFRCGRKLIPVTCLIKICLVLQSHPPSKGHICEESLQGALADQGLSHKNSAHVNRNQSHSINSSSREISPKEQGGDNCCNCTVKVGS